LKISRKTAPRFKGVTNLNVKIVTNIFIKHPRFEVIQPAIAYLEIGPHSSCQMWRLGLEEMRIFWKGGKPL